MLLNFAWTDAAKTEVSGSKTFVNNQGCNPMWISVRIDAQYFSFDLRCYFIEHGPMSQKQMSHDIMYK